jgi:XTP/dITP diphosphohydrolase/tetrapyrrole methylase family protein/MazG family protein
MDQDAIIALAKGLDEKLAGKKLFELAAACRQAGIDPESALRRHTQAVTDAVEDQAHAHAS